jgi:YjgF/chorismate_mutase-like, putative endoribonuclease
VEAGCKAAHLAALNVLAVAQKHLGSLDKVTRIVRLGVSAATSGDVREQPKIADAASQLLQDVIFSMARPRLPKSRLRCNGMERRHVVLVCFCGDADSSQFVRLQGAVVH